MEQNNFSYYNEAWIRKNNISDSKRIEKHQAKVLMQEGGLYVRNTYNFDKEDTSCFWYVVKDKFGDMEELPSKARNQVRKAMKTYDYKLVTYEEMLLVGRSLFNKSRERFGSGLDLTEVQWEERLKRDRQSEFWIGYDRETRVPAAFAINAIYDDYCDYSTMGISPEFPNNTYPMYGLIYEMNRYYLEEKKIAFVCDGARSITGHSNIQSVLEDKFKFRKAYCDLEVFYKPWFGMAVRLLFPFRKLIKHPKVSAILRQEAWARGLYE